ncbi:MAG: hypothetical protein ACR2QT_10130 [Woeseiaceae bacterium]
MRIKKIGWIIALLLLATAVYAQSVSRATYRVIQEAQALAEEDKYAEARTILEALISEITDDPYDFAIVSQSLAHACAMLDDLGCARSSLEAALATPDVPPEMLTDMSLFYGTVLLSEEEYELARDVLETWLANAHIVQSVHIFATGYANYMADDIDRAETLIAMAIDKSDAPKESWYELYYRVLFEQKKFDQAESVQLGLISRNPGKQQHWRTLASHYMQIDRQNEALAAIMIGHHQGLIDNDRDLQQIVSLYGYVDVPEKGARMLQDWINEDRLPEDAATLTQLGSMWLLARERDSAKVVLEKAATLAEDGKSYRMLGGIYFEDEDWLDAYGAYQKAISKGGLDEPHQVMLLAGISAMRAGSKDDAKRALTAALESDELRPQAERLLGQID